MTKTLLFFLLSLFSIGSMQSAAPVISKIDRELLNASAYGALKDVQQALGQGANPNVFNMHGVTPLHYAATRNSEMVEALLNAHADPNLDTPFTEKPLHATVSNTLTQEERNKITNLLIAAKADLEAKNVLERTALQSAAFMGRKKDCTILLKAGAQIPYNLGTTTIDQLDYLDVIQYLDLVILDLNRENQENAKLIQEYLALQPEGVVMPINDLLMAQLTKPHPLASEVIAEKAMRKIQRVSKKMLARKNLKK